MIVSNCEITNPKPTVLLFTRLARLFRTDTAKPVTDRRLLLGSKLTRTLHKHKVFERIVASLYYLGATGAGTEARIACKR